MSVIDAAHPAALAAHVGRTVTAPAHRIDDDLIDAFIAVSGDTQALHRRGASPRIVPGNLLLSLIPQRIQSVLRIAAPVPAMTVKYDAVRFYAPLHAGRQIAAEITIRDVRRRRQDVFVVTDVRVSDADTGVRLMQARVTDCYLGGASSSD